MYSVKKIIKRRIRKIANLYCKTMLKRQPVWEKMEDFQRRIQGCYQSELRYGNLYGKFWLLYKQIIKDKPRQVLELGCGMSTIVIKSALRMNGVGSLVSVEENSEYGKKVEDISGVKIFVSPPKESKYKDLTGTKYEKIPDRNYDFIFIDGPTTKTVDLDAFFILEKNPKIKIMIDNRKKTFNALSLKYPGYFKNILNIGYINI